MQRELVERVVDQVPYALGGLVVATYDQQHRRVEVRGDGRVVRELGAPQDVGEIRAEDHHRVVAQLELGVARDDLAERLVGVAVHRRVLDAVRQVVLPIHRRLVHQRLEDPVTTIRTDDRPEHPDRSDLASQRLDDTQSDGGFPDQPLGRHHVDALRHMPDSSAPEPSFPHRRSGGER